MLLTSPLSSVDFKLDACDSISNRYYLFYSISFFLLMHFSSLGKKGQPKKIQTHSSQSILNLSPRELRYMKHGYSIPNALYHFLIVTVDSSDLTWSILVRI